MQPNEFAASKREDPLRSSEEEEDDDNKGEEREEGEEDPDEDPLSDEKLEESFIKRELLRTIMAKQDVGLLRQIGHQFEDFVVYCTFRGKYCA